MTRHIYPQGERHLHDLRSASECECRCEPTTYWLDLQDLPMSSPLVVHEQLTGGTRKWITEAIEYGDEFAAGEEAECSE